MEQFGNSLILTKTLWITVTLEWDRVLQDPMEHLDLILLATASISMLKGHQVMNFTDTVLLTKPCGKLPILLMVNGPVNYRVHKDMFLVTNSFSLLTMDLTGRKVPQVSSGGFTTPPIAPHGL